MKHLLFLITLPMIISISSASEYTPVTATTMIPMFSTASPLICVGDRGRFNDERIAACVISATSMTLSVFLKAEIKTVEQDAYNALAGEPISFALQEVIEKIREEQPELHEEADLMIVAFLVEVAGLD